MVNSQIVYYMSSKLLAAVINLVTMALFVRLGGTETYGAYLITLASAYILYGVSLQWLRFAFFATYREETSKNLVATYLRALVGGIGLLALGAALAAAAGVVPFGFTAGLIALVAGLASYDALSEVSRTRLQARDVAIGVMTRAALMLILGVAALIVFQSPLALALAVGLAHLIAAGILLIRSHDVLGGTPSRADMHVMWAYGRPLVPAFGLDAVGLQLDRLLLARFTTLDVVGHYGAAADFIRQTMIVIAEAIAGAYIAVARNDAVGGRTEAARRVLGHAFLAYTALTAFAAAIIIRFDRALFDTLFGPELGAEIEPIVPIIVASNVAGIFRAYYFAQVLYLTDSTRVLLHSNVVHVCCMAAGGLVMIPIAGAAGAAAAMLLGHVAGCAVYAWTWRNHYAMQLPYGSALVIALLALGAYLITGHVERSVQSAVLATGLNSIVFGIAVVVAARVYNVLSFNDLSASALSHLRAYVRGSRASG